MRAYTLFASFLILGSISTTAVAETVLYGKVLSIDGHVTAACRTLLLKREDNGALVYFRVPNTGTDNSIESIAITAVVTGKRVAVAYNSGATSGCGSEDAVAYISLLAQ